MLVKIAVNSDFGHCWPPTVATALGACGLAKWVPFQSYIPGYPEGYWDTDQIPRHHPALIAALEEWERSRLRARGEPPYVPGVCEYIREVELPSGRYRVRAAWGPDAILTPEDAAPETPNVAWIEV